MENLLSGYFLFCWRIFLEITKLVVCREATPGEAVPSSAKPQTNISVLSFLSILKTLESLLPVCNPFLLKKTIILGWAWRNLGRLREDPSGRSELELPSGAHCLLSFVYGIKHFCFQWMGFLCELFLCWVFSWGKGTRRTSNKNIINTAGESWDFQMTAPVLPNHSPGC